MPTPIDTARLAEQNQERLVPEGPAPTGSFVAVTGQMPFRYGWSQPPPSRVLEYHGNPDGELNASKGALCTDIDTPDVYQNQDGADSWQLVGSGGSGFPVQVDAYLDTTGISIAGGTDKLPWVIDGTIVTLPSVGLLDLSTPDTPTVIADGYFTFDMFVAPLGTVAADPEARALYKIERGADIALFQPTQTPATTGGGGYTNSNAFSFSYPCLAGDVVTIQVEDNVTNIWALGGSVKSLG